MVLYLEISKIENVKKVHIIEKTIKLKNIKILHFLKILSYDTDHRSLTSKMYLR